MCYEERKLYAGEKAGRQLTGLLNDCFNLIKIFLCWELNPYTKHLFSWLSASGRAPGGVFPLSPFIYFTILKIFNELILLL
jgi:hypothetical protein